MALKYVLAMADYGSKVCFSHGWLVLKYVLAMVDYGSKLCFSHGWLWF